MASYFWFAFFGRCFVFLKDLSSDTIIRTIKKEYPDIYAGLLIHDKLLN